MKFKFQQTIAAFLLSAIMAPTFAQDWKTIRIGVEGAYPPFSSITQSGKLVGFDIDIANALCDTLKAKCELITQDWDGIIPALLARKYDAIIASMSITPERKKKVAFTDKYYQTPARFVRKKGSGIEITKSAMNGKTVGVQRATIHDNFITSEFGDTVKIKRYGTQDEAYLDMTSGRLDLLLADAVVMKAGYLDTDAGSAFEFVGPNFTDPKYFGEGAGIAVRKQNKDLVAALNRAIKQIRRDGTYQKINAKYFNFDIY